MNKSVKEQLNDSSRKLNWLINGLGQHGLKLSDCSKITWDWINENYAVSQYECLHKKVSDISYVVGFSEPNNRDIFVRQYRGFCNSCSKTIWSITDLKGRPIKRWS